MKDVESRKSDNRKVFVGGRVNNPDIYDVPTNFTLMDIINLAGGIKDKNSFKAAQVEVSFGGFLTEKKYK